MNIYNSDFDFKLKEDNSPVTKADFNSNKVICEELSFFNDINILSEEIEDNLDRIKNNKVFIIDPLDGTQDFINKDDTFSINIAYVENNQPIISLIALPVKKEYAYAIKNKGAYYVSNNKKTKMKVSNRKDNLIYLASKTHKDEKEEKIYLNNKHIKKIIYSGASTKAVLLALGLADISIRFTSMTKEWDTCACDLIIKEAGGVFVDNNFNNFTYNKKDVINHNGYIMSNNKENIELLLNHKIGALK